MPLANARRWRSLLKATTRTPLRAKHSPPGVLTRSQEQLRTNHGNSVFRPSLGSWTAIEGSELGGMHEGTGLWARLAVDALASTTPC